MDPKICVTCIFTRVIYFPYLMPMRQVPCHLQQMLCFVNMVFELIAVLLVTLSFSCLPLEIWCHMGVPFQLEGCIYSYSLKNIRDCYLVM